MKESVGVSGLTGTLYTTVCRARFERELSRSLCYGRLGSGVLPGGGETLEEREIVSPATPGRPEDRATPAVLSGGALSVGARGSGRVVS
jgi:hypothetical protein